MTHGPHQNAHDRLLRAVLEARMARGSAESPPGCLDDDVLAAWADNELDARDRAAAEAHAADCARCQSLLAAMVRTAERPSVATSWWRAPVLKWAVPLTAAAAALLVWGVLPGHQTARPDERARPVAAKTPSAARDATLQLAEGERGRGVDRPPAARPSPRVPVENKKADAGKPVAPQSPARAVPPPPAAPSMAAAPVPLVAAPASADSLAAASPEPIEGARSRVSAQGSAQASFARAAREEAAVMEIVSPDNRARWRLSHDGGVQRSSDAGATWQVQQTGTGVTFVAGASPSAYVCWLVGPRGAVVLQTDGSTWHRIAFPEPVDLASIRAADERRATLTTADGRTFETTDGGVTWNPSP